MGDPRRVRSEIFSGAQATGLRALHQVVGFIAMSHLIAIALGVTNASEPDLGVGEALFAAWAPAVAEELLFRGVLFEMLRRLAGPATAIAGSAVLFALVHSGSTLMLAAGLLGLQLGALRLGHGLALALVAHAANNTVAVFGESLVEALSMGANLALPAELQLGLAMIFAGTACAALAQEIRRSRNAPPSVTSGLQHIPGLDD